MSLKHCESHQLPIQKLVLVRLDTMLDLLANSPASVAAFAMRVWGCGCGGVGCEGCGGCRGMPGEALLGPDTFSNFPLLPTHPPTQHGCSNSSSRNQPNGCAASEPQKHRQHGMCTMAPRGAEKKWLTTRHWSTSSHSRASVCNRSWAWPRQSVPRGTVMPLASPSKWSTWFRLSSSCSRIMPPLEKRATLTLANDDEEAAAWDTVGCYMAFHKKSGAEEEEGQRPGGTCTGQRMMIFLRYPLDGSHIIMIIIITITITITTTIIIIIIIIMGRMGICFTSMATSWWGKACCLLLCFPTGTYVLFVALIAILNFDYLGGLFTLKKGG